MTITLEGCSMEFDNDSIYETFDKGKKVDIILKGVTLTNAKIDVSQSSLSSFSMPIGMGMTTKVELMTDYTSKVEIKESQGDDEHPFVVSEEEFKKDCEDAETKITNKMNNFGNNYNKNGEITW